MARKSITRVNGHALSNLDDRDSVITILLKRVCTFEEAVDYLLSAIPETRKDDMLGELSTWDDRRAEMLRIRSGERARMAKQARKAEARFANKVTEIKIYRACGWSLRSISSEFNVSVSAVKAVLAGEQR